MKQLCYWCGREAIYQFKNGKWCCSKSYNSCPVLKEKNRTSHKKKAISIKTDKLCEYNCGKTAKFILPNQKYCCSDNRNKCIALKEKNRYGKVGIPLPEYQKNKIREKATGRKRSLDSIKKQSNKMKELWSDRNSIYNDPIFLKSRASTLVLKGASFDVFEPQLKFCEDVRRDKNDKRILSIKCTYCGKRYTPKKLEVYNRVACLKNTDPNINAESRFYCSQECKGMCPIFKKIR